MQTSDIFNYNTFFLVQIYTKKLNSQNNNAEKVLIFLHKIIKKCYDLKKQTDVALQ